MERAGVQERMMTTLRLRRLVRTVIRDWQRTRYVLLDYQARASLTEFRQDGVLRRRFWISPSSPYRMMFPFFLIIAVFLLLLWHFAPSGSPPMPSCPPNGLPYRIQGGDTCWGLAQISQCTLEALKELNPKMDCSKLMPRDWICLPRPIGSTPTAH